MNRKTLCAGGKWSDDTVYTADRKQYDIRLSDTVTADDKRYTIHGHTSALHTAFYIRGHKNITLDFGGATVYLHGKLQPFVLDGCENVTVKNVIVRYDRCPYTEGKIVSADADTLTLAVSDDFPYRTEDGELIITSETWENHDLDKAPIFLQFFDGETHRGVGIHLAIFGNNPQIDPSLPWGPYTLKFTAERENGHLVLHRFGSMPMPPVRVGQIAVIAHEPRDLSNIQMVCCKNVSLVNYRIINGVGMGIFPFRCENVTLDHVILTCDGQSPGVVSNAADAVHAFACSGDFVMRDCVIEGMTDDALNIHSNYYTVKEVRGDTIIAHTGLEPNENTSLFAAGDTIAVYRGFTLDRAAVYTLTDVRPFGEKLVALTLDRTADMHTENDAIENLTTQCRLTVTNCRFGKANTHLRFQTRGDILIENSETELPLWLTGDMSYWFESSPCEHFTVRNTDFHTAAAIVKSMPEFFPTDAAPYYHGTISLENCRFDTASVLEAAYTEKIVLRNVTKRDGGTRRITLTNCNEADADGFDIERKTEHKTALGNN